MPLGSEFAVGGTMSGREREEAREAVMGVHIKPLEDGQHYSRAEEMGMKWKRKNCNGRID